MMPLMKMKANVVRYCVRGILMLSLSLSLIGCSKVSHYYYRQRYLWGINTRVPNKSVFEPLTAKQIRKCYQLYYFDDFYSKYCPKILKCGHQENVMFADITWRNLYKYYEFSEYEGVDMDDYHDYMDKCADSWDNEYGRYEEEVDSLLTFWSKEVRHYINNYIEPYVDVALEKATFSEWSKSRDTLYTDRGYASFKLTPKYDPITKCEFKWHRVNFIVKGAVIDRTAIRDFKVKYPNYLYYDKQDDSIRVTDVSLLNGKEYSIHNLQIPEHYSERILRYVLSNSDSDREQSRESLLRYYFKEEHGRGSYGLGGYINKSDYMSEHENAWTRSRYAREMDFVEALKKLE